LINDVLYPLILIVSLLLTAQGAIALYLMLYTWWQPRRLEEAASPTHFLPPQLRFTAILPARHEEEVIAGTIARVWAANYPRDLLEVVLVCEHGDEGTIAEELAACARTDHPNVRVLTFNDGPINKPHGLNYALRHTSTRDCHHLRRGRRRAPGYLPDHQHCRDHQLAVRGVMPKRPRNRIAQAMAVGRTVRGLGTVLARMKSSRAESERA